MVGVDIVAIARIEKMIDRFGQKGLRRYLSEDEIALIKRVETAAGFWAAKEAIAKALGCGIGADLAFHDILLTKNEKGAPTFTLSPKALQKFPIKSASLSIAHDGGFAIAVAAVELDSTAADKR